VLVLGILYGAVANAQPSTCAPAITVALGTADTIATLEHIRAACPDSHVTLTGYSQGARIAGDVLEKRPELADEGVLVSDPRKAGSGIETQLPGVPFMGADFAGEREPFTMPVTSQCIAGDPICDMNLYAPCR
jgi:pimeloyl-ACP methyl ester carboxylesterase